MNGIGRNLSKNQCSTLKSIGKKTGFQLLFFLPYLTTKKRKLLTIIELNMQLVSENVGQNNLKNHIFLCIILLSIHNWEMHDRAFLFLTTEAYDYVCQRLFTLLTQNNIKTIRDKSCKTKNSFYNAVDET